MPIKYISNSTSIGSVKPLIWLVKFIVVVLLGILIFDKIVDYELSPEIFDNFINQITKLSKVWAFILCLVLMVGNWVLEVVKWKALIDKFHNQSFIKCAEAVLVGIASGIITPSRLGEYGGRIINLPKELRAKGIHAHFLASLSQNSINILMGAIGALIYTTLYLSWSSYLVVSLFSIACVSLILLLMIYFNQHELLKIVINKLPGKLRSKLHIEKGSNNNYGTSILNYALVISFIRYVVFSTQYALLLYFFGIEISLIATLSGISLIYLIQSGVPLPPFLSMLARGEIALIVWSVFDASVLSILSATFTLWIVNLLLPAIVGAYILLKNPSNSV